MKTLLSMLCGLALALAATPALAQPMPAAAGIAECVATEQDMDRLACYDALFRVAQAEPSLVLASDQQILAHPSGRANAEIAFFCDNAAPRLEFSFAGHTLSAMGANVGISVKRDARSSRALSLRPGSDGIRAIMDRRSDVEAFLQSLEGVSSLSLETRTADYRSISVRFQLGTRIADLTAALGACR